jgi:hypothetical protein
LRVQATKPGPRFGISPSCSAGSPRPRPPGGSSNGPPRIPTGWRVCVPPAHMPALARGRPAATPMSSCWSSMPTRPWSWRTVMPSRACRLGMRVTRLLGRQHRPDHRRCWPSASGGRRAGATARLLPGRRRPRWYRPPPQGGSQGALSGEGADPAAGRRLGMTEQSRSVNSCPGGGRAIARAGTRPCVRRVDVRAPAPNAPETGLAGGPPLALLDQAGTSFRCGSRRFATGPRPARVVTGKTSPKGG